ncbi:MAG: hypothetical protein HMLKMBBP_03620 [Planctomycetes bacterium]|nr:hypothetical protein [Planctomycetota bacterium]
MTAAAPDRSFRLFLAAAAALAGLFVGVLRTRPPAPVGADAPPTVFSAARALVDLQAVLGGDAPHPIGSAASKAVRERLAARLRSVGMDVEVQRDWVVVAGQRQAAWVENVVGRIPGARSDLPPVVIACHHDSVGAGPGAADDGIGMATAIEAVRALRASPQLAAPVHVLVTDGEEAGLLGAWAFVRRNPGPIAAIVNVEARGNSGPMLMFETAGASADLLSAWCAAAPRPVTGSLFDWAYRMLPNSTDVAVLRRLDVPILNFACIGRPQHYHTPRDTIAHIDPGTLQHAGESVLAAVRAAASAAGAPAAELRLVWHDVLGFAVPRWPVSWTLPLAAMLLAAHLAFAWRAVRSGVAFGVPSMLVAWLAGVAAAWGVSAALRASGVLDRAMPASPGWTAAALVGAAVWAATLVACAASRLLPKRLGGDAHAASAGPLVALFGVAVSALLPELAPLWLIASAALLACGVVPALRDVGGGFAAAAVFAPLAVFVADGFGVAGAAPGLPVAIPLLGVLATTAVLPLAGAAAAAGARGLAVAAASLCAAVAGAIGAAAVPTVTPELPGKLSFLYRADASDPHAHVMLLGHGEPIPESVLAKLETEPDLERVLPWTNLRAVAAEAPRADVPPPVLADLRKADLAGGRRVSFRLRSQRGAPDLVLAVEPTARVRRLVIGGVSQPPESWRDERIGILVRFHGIPDEGVSIEMDIADAAEVQAYVGDLTPGLPPGCREILEARPSTHVPAHQGDQTAAVRRLRL